MLHLQHHSREELQQLMLGLCSAAEQSVHQPQFHLTFSLSQDSHAKQVLLDLVSEQEISYSLGWIQPAWPLELIQTFSTTWNFVKISCSVKAKTFCRDILVLTGKVERETAMFSSPVVRALAWDVVQVIALPDSEWSGMKSSILNHTDTHRHTLFFPNQKATVLVWKLTFQPTFFLWKYLKGLVLFPMGNKNYFQNFPQNRIVVF